MNCAKNRGRVVPTRCFPMTNEFATRLLVNLRCSNALGRRHNSHTLRNMTKDSAGNRTKPEAFDCLALMSPNDDQVYLLTRSLLEKGTLSISPRGHQPHASVLHSRNFRRAIKELL